MKKLLLLFMLLVTVSNYAQEAYTEEAKEMISTTEKEYNYLTIGYKEDLAAGKDIIAGYSFGKIYVRTVGDYKFESFYLYHNKTIKAILTTIQSDVSKQKHYVCIPINNSELLKKHFEKVKTFTLPLAQAYSVATGEMAINLATNNH